MLFLLAKFIQKVSTLGLPPQYYLDIHLVAGPYEDLVGGFCRLQQDNTGLVASGQTVCAACRESALHYTICEKESCQCMAEGQQWYGGVRCETKLEAITTEQCKLLIRLAFSLMDCFLCLIPTTVIEDVGILLILYQSRAIHRLIS